MCGEGDCQIPSNFAATVGQKMVFIANCSHIFEPQKVERAYNFSTKVCSAMSGFNVCCAALDTQLYARCGKVPAYDIPPLLLPDVETHKSLSYEKMKTV